MRARDLLRHAIPTGDTAEIIDRALTLLLADLDRTRRAATKRPQRGGGTAAGSRHIPAEVMRAVSTRDGEQCAFTSKTGHRCTATAFLEFHHVVPYAVGGPATMENIVLRCQAHNAYEAEVYYGRRTRSGTTSRPVATSPAPLDACVTNQAGARPKRVANAFAIAAPAAPS
jgi:hypothetical protein